jgi:hypothetical protein
MASKRALLVGIDQYPDPRNNLNSCVADTQRFRGLLQNFYGFSPQDITLLHNNAATLTNVRVHLSSLLQGVSPGDQIVFYESSHGYRYVKGSTFVEVLCLYDQFLEDTELVQLSQQVPPGTFTCTLDACHSAGLEKLFFAPDGLHTARAKVWQPPPERAAADAAMLTQATSFKSFARAATSDTGAVAKQFSAEAFGANAPPAAKAGEGQPELNGVLFAACLADQTAAAGSTPTDGLSAFTWALGLELEAGGVTMEARALRDRVDQRLQSLNMRQTPAVEAPMAHGGWLTQALITYDTASANGSASAPPAASTPTPSTAADGEFDSFLQGLGISEKGMSMTADRRQEGAAKPRAKKAAQKSATSDVSAGGAAKESDMSVTSTSTSTSAESAGAGTAGSAYEKGWGDLFSDIIPDIVGPVARGLGVDPRVAGQAASQVMSIFGIGGAGKAFTASVPKADAVAQLQQIVAPCLANPAETKALNAWLKAAVEPVQAYQGGKAFQPNYSKSWLSDAWDSVADTVSDVDWGKVGQIGLQALPYVIAAL